MNGTGQSFFAGLSAEELPALLAQLERRLFPAGALLLMEGDSPSAMYVIQSGTAEVLVADRYGRSHKVDQARPGDVLGEMSLLTGQPVSATVRALTDIEALVIAGADFERIGSAFPLIFRNLGVLLADRLRRSHLHRLSSHAEAILLQNAGAPTSALLGYALACSMAWHARRPVLFIVHGDRPPEGLDALAAQSGADAEAAGLPRPCARVLSVRPEGEYAPEALSTTLDRLGHSYDHVLLLSTVGAAVTEAPGLAARTVRLAGPANEANRVAPAGNFTGERRSWHTLRAWAAGSSAVGPRKNGALDVPPLGPADHDALRTGLLAASSPAGRALGWAARELCGLKVGLALGAGSEKGYAHLGVLRVLERAGVPLDYLAGTSIGAAVAASRAGGHSPDEIERFFTSVGQAAFRFRFQRASLLSSAGLRDRMRDIAGRRRFEDLPIPLAVVAADLVTGREVVFRKGVVWPALVASMAIPGIYPAQRIGPYMLVDGGILDSVPGDVVAGLGADKVIGVNLSSNPTPPPIEAETAQPRGAPPSALKVLRSAVEIMQRNVSTRTQGAGTILIEPTFEAPGSGSWRRLRTFNEGRRYMDEGEAAAEAALPRLAEALPWLKT
jgi:NTE family protein